MCEQETRPCRCCDGTAVASYDASKPCYACDGRGYFTAPAVDAIWSMIVNPKTGKTYSTSLHSAAGRKRHTMGPTGEWRRAQYVWRMARFHAGVTSANLGGPIMASMDIAGDPYVVELDNMADQVARKCHGTDMAAAKRWHRAFYGA